ncbi:hypothetical protein ACJ5H2_05820 [Nocardioides sp. R1-1]|uniref:hypothetical protein n=1 Tax=Nocardioides sp. R1-1 TaxID=3383502 RepID=UPI0038CF75A4
MRFRVTFASMGILGASVLLATPALAVDWGSASNPVFGYENGKKFGKMYGKFYNDNSVSAMSTTWQYDLRPGGNKVRVETDFYWYRICQSYQSSPSWCPDVSKQTEETNTASWVKDSRARNLRFDSSASRGGIDICEIQAWSNDPCSPQALPQFSY